MDDTKRTSFYRIYVFSRWENRAKSKISEIIPRNIFICLFHFFFFVLPKCVFVPKRNTIASTRQDTSSRARWYGRRHRSCSARRDIIIISCCATENTPRPGTWTTRFIIIVIAIIYNTENNTGLLLSKKKQTLLSRPMLRVNRKRARNSRECPISFFFSVCETPCKIDRIINNARNFVSFSTGIW